MRSWSKIISPLSNITWAWMPLDHTYIPTRNSRLKLELYSSEIYSVIKRFSETIVYCNLPGPWITFCIHVDLHLFPFLYSIVPLPWNYPFWKQPVYFFRLCLSSLANMSVPWPWYWFPRRPPEYISPLAYINLSAFPQVGVRFYATRLINNSD